MDLEIWGLGWIGGVHKISLFSFTGPLVESLTMVLFASYLIFLSNASGIPCNYRVFNLKSSILFFSYHMSLFTMSNLITNFVKSGPIRLLPEENYRGHLIALVCNMFTICFKIWFVMITNQLMNDNIYSKLLIPRSLENGIDFQTTTLRYLITLLLCVRMN